MIQPTECDESTETSHSFHENIAFFFYPIRMYCNSGDVFWRFFFVTFSFILKTKEKVNRLNCDNSNENQRKQ